MSTSRINLYFSRLKKFSFPESQVRKSVELTNELKTDSDLCPIHERPNKTIRESQRICRCAQIKLLKEKTIEKIRLSQESERLSAETASKPSSRQVTKEVVDTGIINNEIVSAEFIQTASEPLSLASSSRVSLVPSVGKKEDVDLCVVCTLPRKPVSKPDVLLTSAHDDSDELLKESEEFMTLPKFDHPEPTQYRFSLTDSSNRSSRETRYSQLIDNDMFGGMELPVSNFGSDSYQRLSILHGKLLSEPKLESKEERYSAIFHNDAMKCFAVEMKDISSQKSSVPTLSEESIDSLLPFPKKSAVLICPITPRNTTQTETTAPSRRHICNKQFQLCSESCDSHKKPHPCSQKVPSCASSCPSCQSHILSVDDGVKVITSMQYDADDEKSSIFEAIKSGESVKSKICGSMEVCELKHSSDSSRVCACSKKYPDLFKKEEAK